MPDGNLGMKKQKCDYGNIGYGTVKEAIQESKKDPVWA